MSVPVFQVGPPGYFIHVSITTPIVTALKNYLKYFWIQVAVSEVKRQLRNRFGSETVTNL
jgi:hypothetical protein